MEKEKQIDSKIQQLIELCEEVKFGTITITVHEGKPAKAVEIIKNHIFR